MDNKQLINNQVKELLGKEPFYFTDALRLGGLMQVIETKKEATEILQATNQPQ